MPKVKLNTKLLEIKRHTGMTMDEIREKAMIDYLAKFDFNGAIMLKIKARKKTILYAIKKHGTEARSVLSTLRIPITAEELPYYKEYIKEYLRTYKPTKQSLSLNRSKNN